MSTPSGPPSGPPSSGPPSSGPPSGPPSSGPPAGPPRGAPSGGPPSGGRPPAADQGFQLNRNQLIGIVAVVAILLGVLVGVLAGGGGGDGGGNDKSASNGSSKGKAERTIKLEPIASTSNAPFTPPLSPDTTASPPSTITPPPSVSGQTKTPFGGTGNNSLCDREALISFLTNPANAAQGREWARIVGISISDIPTYVRSLIPTILQYDTRVTNHTFVNGRAVPLQSVLQAGTAVLVDQYGKLIARCRCGNPLIEPTKVSDPIYTGPKWPGFDPTIIIIIVPTQTPVFPPGGVTEPTAWQFFVNAEGQNIRRTKDSTVRVQWKGTFQVNGTTISGTGSGTVDFNGGCYNLSTGEKISDQHTSATFDVQITGSASGTVPNRTYALSFTPGNFQVTDFGVQECRSATNGQAFQDGTTEVFTALNVPAQNIVQKQFSEGEYQGSYTMCGTPNTSAFTRTGVNCA
jgi:hypothetical protein